MEKERLLTLKKEQLVNIILRQEEMLEKVISMAEKQVQFTDKVIDSIK